MNTTGFSIQEVTGDLFQSQCALAHCVSQDLHMGKGIAVTFREEYGRIKELEAQNKGVGQVAVLVDSKVSPVDNPYKQPEWHHDRYLFYLITKHRYFHKPTYDSLRATLRGKSLGSHTSVLSHTDFNQRWHLFVWHMMYRY